MTPSDAPLRDPPPRRRMLLRRGTVPIAVLITAIAILALLGGAIVLRGERVIRDLAQAQSDDLVWSVAQAEVEYLSLLAEVERLRTAPDPAPDLTRLRVMFDVFYSRLTLLNDGSAYRQSLSDPALAPRLARPWQALRALEPVFDQADADLLASVRRGGVGDVLTLMRDDLRRLASGTVLVRAKADGLARDHLMRVMGQLGAITALLILALALLALVIWRLFRLARARARSARQASQRMAAIFTTSRDAIVVTDATGCITDMNAAAERMFGHTAAGVSGHAIDLLLDLPADGVEVDRLRVTGRDATGRDLPLELTRGRAGVGEDGLCVYVLRDITDRLRTEERLRDSLVRANAGARAKARFLAVMSHEMRTPLTGILGAIGLLRATDCPDEAARYAEILEGAGETLLSHINAVLDISEIEAEGVVLARAPVDLAGLADEVLAEAAPLATRNGTALRRSLTLPGGAVVLGDRQRLRQILTNLISNAIKHTKGGTVDLDISAPKDRDSGLVEIQVSDTGVGIAPEMQERIFDDFVRLDGAVAGHEPGTGLGLGIVRRLVQAMGGQIGVDSEPGAGSLFWLRLPLPVADAPAPGPLNTPRKPATRLRVLLVEDNAANRDILRQMLTRDGHAVTEADTGRTGLAAAQETGFDLILMDLSMPEMTGVEAVRRIRAGTGPNRAAWIVALTAHVNAAQDAEVAMAGFDRIVTKPLTWDGLRALLLERSPPGEARKPPQPVADITSVPVLDPQAIATLAATLSPRDLAGLVQELAQEGRTLLKRLAQPPSTPAGRQDMVQTVHKLAGTAALLGTRRLHLALSTAETAIWTGGDIDIAGLQTQHAAALAAMLATEARQAPRHADQGP